MTKLLIVPKGWTKGEPLELVDCDDVGLYAIKQVKPYDNDNPVGVRYHWMGKDQRQLFLDWWHDRLRKVKFAADCPPCDYCGEPVCTDCDEHYSECQCVGPAQLDDYETREIDGELYYYVRPTV